MKKIIIIVILCLMSWNQMGCSNQAVHTDGYKYVIGVSIPNAQEPWIRNMMGEIRAEVTVKYPDTNIIFKDATDSLTQQIADIEALLESKVDLLIVTPIANREIGEVLTQKEVTTPVPVIIAGVDSEMDKYASVIKFDDVKIGKIAGEYILKKLYSQGDKVAVITGREYSVLSENRLKGFKEAIKGAIPENDIKYYNGEWLKDKAEDRMKDYLVLYGDIDIVFAFNDEMAYGAYEAAHKLRVAKANFVGVDGFSGKEGGKELVEQEIINATISCTGIGEKSIETARKILEGKEVDKKIVLGAELIQ